jgi:hypothetical protein
VIDRAGQATPAANQRPRWPFPELSGLPLGVGALGGCGRAVEGPNDPALPLAGRHNVSHISGNDPVEPIPARSCSGEETCVDLAADRLIPRRSQP